MITFDWNIDGVADHIAIVEKVEGDKVITIEGNTSDRNYDESKVVRKSHRLNARYIMALCQIVLMKNFRKGLSD